MQYAWNHQQEQNPYHPNAGAQELAAAYCTALGFPPPQDTPYVNVIPAISKRIAAFYSNAPDAPKDPAVRAAWKALADEVEAQWAILPVDVEAFGDGTFVPYKNSEAMMDDVQNNAHLWVYNGGDDHAIFTREQNFRFRAVHDFFGHCQHGFAFGPRGEENAWMEHSKMFSPLARAALTTETRGQNSWVNFGPFSHLPVTERPYATQKVFLLPPEFQTNAALQAAYASWPEFIAPVAVSRQTQMNGAEDDHEILLSFQGEGGEIISDPATFAKELVGRWGAWINLNEGNALIVNGYTMHLEYLARDGAITEGFVERLNEYDEWHNAKPEIAKVIHAGYVRVTCQVAPNYSKHPGEFLITLDMPFPMDEYAEPVARLFSVLAGKYPLSELWINEFTESSNEDVSDYNWVHNHIYLTKFVKRFFGEIEEDTPKKQVHPIMPKPVQGTQYTPGGWCYRRIGENPQPRVVQIKVPADQVLLFKQALGGVEIDFELRGRTFLFEPSQAKRFFNWMDNEDGVVLAGHDNGWSAAQIKAMQIASEDINQQLE